MAREFLCNWWCATSYRRASVDGTQNVQVFRGVGGAENDARRAKGSWQDDEFRGKKCLFPIEIELSERST